MKDDGGLYGIGALAQRTGVSVRTIRFWCDSGVVPATTRSAAGHRLYDARALALVELVATLRKLGLGLRDIRAVLEGRASVADVAAVHVRALDTEIRALRLQRAVLSLIAGGGTTTEETKMLDELARLSASERRRLVDEFITESFGNINDSSGIGERMRQVTPALPEDPTPEQLQAWVEVARLVQDPSFRARVREMAVAGAERAGDQPFDREQGKAFAATVSEHAAPALATGVDPASPEAEDVIRRILPDAGPSRRAELARELATFTDARVERYWQLVAVINGWGAFPSATPAFQWLIDALNAHGRAAG
jgi:DNA-binding transcriptional MerR regulator